jgi:hypothetical protein
MLLFCTLVGLALMHTIGHTGPHAGQHHQLAAMPVAAGGMSALVPADCPAGHCDGHDPGAMSGWSVCVAVLGGLVAVALLAALLSWMMSGRGRAWETAARRLPVPRGPPRRAAGLSLVSVAVLRV